jgi:hypothetical protein
MVFRQQKSKGSISVSRRNNLNHHGKLTTRDFQEKQSESSWQVDNKRSKSLDLVIRIVFFENNLNITMATIQTRVFKPNLMVNPAQGPGSGF